MVRIKVAELLGKHKMNRKQLSELTGIRPNTVSMLYDETIKRIDIDIINKLCKAFNCNIEDIFEYTEDPED